MMIECWTLRHKFSTLMIVQHQILEFDLIIVGARSQFHLEHSRPSFLEFEEKQSTRRNVFKPKPEKFFYSAPSRAVEEIKKKPEKSSHGQEF